MKTNETIKWQEEQALQRYQLIAPLLDESLDNAKRIQMREAVAEQNGLSPRTLYRYEAAYRKGGFPGLKPQGRETKRSPKLPENFDELLEQAVRCFFDLTPAGMIRALQLDRPIFADACNYGHFTRASLPWEQTGQAGKFAELCAQLDHGDGGG